MVELSKLLGRVPEVFQDGLLRGTAWLLFAQGVKLGVQVAFFIWIARLLGSRDYGAFVGASALAAVAAPFASIGTETIILRDATKERRLLNVSFGNALLITLALGIPLVGALNYAVSFFLPSEISPAVFLAVCLSEIVFLKFVVIAGNAYLCVDNYARVAQISVLMSFKNLLSCVAFWMLPPARSLADWALINCSLTAVLAFALLCTASIELGAPRVSVSKLFGDLGEGLFFCVDRSAYTIYNMIDKYMLVALSTLEAAGIYSAAYRVIEVAFVPVSSLMMASFSRFFRKGRLGISQSLSFAKGLVPVSVCYASVAVLAIFLGSPFITRVLGAGYEDVPSAMVWLAPMLLIRAVLYFGGDVLTGAGYQRPRTFIQITFTLLNVLLNACLIPQHAWLGAAWATLVSELLLAGCLWSAAFYLDRRARH